MTHLFSPLELRSVTLRNRIVVSPMMQYATPDGLAGPWHLVHLGSRAVGGAAVVMVEQTAIDPRGRSSLYDMGLWNDAQAQALAPITGFIAEQGAVPGIQLGHSGRKGSLRRPWDARTPLSETEGGWQPVAPSAVASGPGAPPPRALTGDEIGALIEAFGQAAGRAAAAGFQLLELHGGHGYLVHQFLSPITNLRDDEYGGDVQRRSRFVLDLVRAVRQRWPAALPLSIRLSATDGAEGGNTLEDTLALVPALREAGVDVIDLSPFGLGAGGSPGVELHAGQAAEIRRRTGVTTATVGGVTGAEQADHIIRSGQADLVVLARAMLRDPYWAAHAARALGQPVPHPVQYARAW